MSTTPKINKLTREQLVGLISAMPDGQKKVRAVELAVRKYASFTPTSQKQRFNKYKFKPAEYIQILLKWTAWTGMDEAHPGQFEILEACALVMRQQEEKDLYEKGELKREQLTCWKPGQTVKNWIRVESGNGIGKTKSASGILNWFLDCFVPSAIFTFAPGGDQARFAMWAEIRKDRENKGLPGRVLETEIKISGYHFAAHRTVSDGLGKGEERIKGKHEAYQLFILDEADGIPDFVFDSITSMTSGGNSLVIMFANPKSRASMFHRVRNRSYVQSFRVSTLYHPNVVAGMEVVPGAVKRDFVERKIENDCDIIHEHRCEETDEDHIHDGCFFCDGDHKELHVPDDFTFELPYAVTIGEKHYLPGTIFRPNPRFMTDILGITPPNSADNTVVPVGRYEAAKKRVPEGGDPTFARVGLDAARFGGDLGKMYIRWQDAVWLACEFFKQKTEKYVETIREECLKLKEKGVKSLHLRIDAGYGGGIIDALRIDDELIKAFDEYEVFEVHFGSTKTYSPDYYDIVTEMYFEAAESLKGIAVINPPEALEIDLCEREYDYRNVGGKTKKKLEQKPDFKKRKKHSPDDGDGFVLAVAPDYCFKKVTVAVVSSPGMNPLPTQTTAVEDIANILGL